jgi:hypothetical protein
MATKQQQELTLKEPASENKAVVKSGMSREDKQLMVALQKFQQQLDKQPEHIIEETMGGQRFKHLPISYVEHLLKKLFFGLYQIEVVDYRLVVNQITVHARIKLWHPIIKQWISFDGLGSIAVQQDSGTKPADFINSIKSNALHINLPAAYAYAVKNAAKKIGKVFGGDLNRKYEDNYEGFPINLDEPLNP